MGIRGSVLWPSKISKLKLTHSFAELTRAFLLSFTEEERRAETIVSFEEEFARGIGGLQALAFPHARVALHFILRAFHFEGDGEILLAPLTIADMVNSIHLAGLRPKFVDMEPLTLGLDPDALERAITPRTRAILITYLGGIMPDVEKIVAIARRHGLKVIEDCSQALGSQLRGKPAGTWGDAAVFSLTNFKIVSSLFGGMVLTRDAGLAARLRAYRETELGAPDRRLLRQHTLKNLIYLVLFQRRIFSFFTYFLVLGLEYLAPELSYRLYSGNIGVVLGVKTNERLFHGTTSPNAGDSDYDHIVPVVGFGSNHALSDGTYYADDTLVFSDNGLWTPDNESPPFLFEYAFATFPATRQGANASQEVYSLNNSTNYGIALTGVLDPTGVTLPVRLHADRGDEPPIDDGSTTRPPAVPVKLTVTVSGLQPGVAYRLYRYSGFPAVPDSGFNGAATRATQAWDISVAYGTTYTLTDGISSSDTAVYRAVPASAP